MLVYVLMVLYVFIFVMFDKKYLIDYDIVDKKIILY